MSASVAIALSQVGQILCLQDFGRNSFVFSILHGKSRIPLIPGILQGGGGGEEDPTVPNWERPDERHWPPDANHSLACYPWRSPFIPRSLYA